MDRRLTALLPLLDEIVANRSQHQQVIGVGSGIRSRHILSVGVDPGLPRTNPSAKLIPDIRAEELLRMQLPTLPIEPVLLQC